MHACTHADTTHTYVHSVDQYASHTHTTHKPTYIYTDYPHTYIHTYIHTCTYTYINTDRQTVIISQTTHGNGGHTHIHVRIHTYIYTQTVLIHTYIHTHIYIHTHHLDLTNYSQKCCGHTYVYTYIHTGHPNHTNHTRKWRERSSMRVRLAPVSRIICLRRSYCV